MTRHELLCSLLVAMGRDWYRDSLRGDLPPHPTPQPGDLVVEVSLMTEAPDDPDAIAWLIADDLAPWDEQCQACGLAFDTGDALTDVFGGGLACAGCNTWAAARRVQDVVPLSGARLRHRWENSTFVALSDAVAMRLREPEHVEDLNDVRMTLAQRFAWEVEQLRGRMSQADYQWVAPLGDNWLMVSDWALEMHRKHGWDPTPARALAWRKLKPVIVA